MRFGVCGRSPWSRTPRFTKKGMVSSKYTSQQTYSEELVHGDKLFGNKHDPLDGERRPSTF